MFNWVNEEFYVKLNNKNIKIVPKNSSDRFTAVSPYPLTPLLT